MSDPHELLDDLAGAGRQLREKIPGVYSGYVKMAAAATGEGGELPARMKELIALAIAVTRECDGCIAAHARGAARQGRERAGGRRGAGHRDLDERRAGHGLGAPGLCRLPGVRRRAVAGHINQRRRAVAGHSNQQGWLAAGSKPGIASLGQRQYPALASSPERYREESESGVRDQVRIRVECDAGRGRGGAQVSGRAD